MAAVNIGEIIKFVVHEWRVLDINGGAMFLLSREIIEQRSYHNKNADTSWEHCGLRNYINSSFLRSFERDDRNRIAQVRVPNTKNPEYGNDGGKHTNDHVFLLSYDEAKKYLPTH